MALIKQSVISCIFLKLSTKGNTSVIYEVAAIALFCPFLDGIFVCKNACSKHFKRNFTAYYTNMQIVEFPKT